MSTDWKELHRRLETTAEALARAAAPSTEERRSILKNRARALAREPEQISVMDIVEVFEHTAWLDGCLGGMVQCDSKHPCGLHNGCKPLRKAFRRFLEQTTLADMTQSLRAKIEKVGKKVPEPKSRSKPVRVIL